MDALQLLAESMRIIAICVFLQTLGKAIVWIGGFIGFALLGDEK